MTARFALCLAAALIAAPAFAQPLPTQPMPAQPVAAPAEEPEAAIDVVDEADWKNLDIAITDFATDADVPTPANAGTTAQLGRSLSRIIAGNLRNNGLFKPAGPEGLPNVLFGEVQSPNYLLWQGRGSEMLVQGSVRASGDGQLAIGCYLYDIALKQQLAGQVWTIAPGDWRRAAHKCSDLVYSRLSGENPFFDSRVAYIAESGPKNRRMKRLAVMDSDGANLNYLTSGQAIALTPRYSPDYKSILYLSYLNGRPSIYVIDPNTKAQRLIVRNANPTFAPRWSPDGRWILYSMATAGNTDIYRVSAQGGESQRLTNAPGINIGGSYSPDGSRIVFESDRSGSQQIYVMNADGTDQRRISFFGGRAATPEWSPRGDQIAFTRIAGNFRIAVMSPSGGAMRELTDSWQDEAPSWAPNGRIIQFFRNERGSGKTSIWQVDLTGRNERRLPTIGDASDPAWGPVRP
jgi:TolB protein